MAAIDLDEVQAKKQAGSSPKPLDLDGPPRTLNLDSGPAAVPKVVALAQPGPSPPERVGAISNLWTGMKNYFESGDHLIMLGHPFAYAAINAGVSFATHPIESLETISKGVTGVPGEIKSEFQSSEQQMGKGIAQITHPLLTERAEKSEAGTLDTDPSYHPFKQEIRGIGNFVFGETGAVLSPVTGAIESAVARPTAALTHLPEPAVSAAAQIAIPLGIAGGIRKLVTLENTLRTGEGASQSFAESWNEIINPHQVSKKAEEAATVIREEHSRSALYQKASQAKIEHALNQANIGLKDKVIGIWADGFHRMPEHQRVAFLDAMESGDYDRIPKAFQPVAKAMRDTLDQNLKLIEGLDRNEINNYIRNYFPHIFKDPDRSAARLQQMMDDGSISMEGAKSFLKDRVFRSYAEARGAGFEPVTTNPVLLTLMRTRDVQRYVMANRVMKRFTEMGLAKWVPYGEKAPEGMLTLPDKISKAASLGKDSIGAGQWAVQNDAARLVMRYFKPGLFERNDIIGSASRGIRLVNNFYNQAQLGFSLFHVGFVTLDSMTSTAALAAREISGGIGERSFGRVLGGIGKLASAPVSPVTLVVKGTKLRNAIRNLSPADVYAEHASFQAPGSDMDRIVRGFIGAGGIADRPEVYSARMAEPWQEAIRSTPGRVAERLKQAVGPKKGVVGNLAERPVNILQAAGEALRGPAGAIAAAEDKLMGPIFQELVPRMKLGVFYQHAQTWLEQHPDAGYGEMAHEMGLIWDSVENRLGEMDLDRRFWNQTLKDTSLLALRAVGWNYGTLHELGGGATDAVKDFGAFLNEGKMSYRMSYIFGLAVNTAVVGSLATYVNTGKVPQQFKDYVFPPDGHGGRMAMPTYAKEVYEWPLHPVDTVGGKLAPIWSALYAVAQNKDHYGATVYDPRFPWYDWNRIMEEGRFFGQQLEPFSIASYERTETKHGLAGYLASPSMFGFTKAPSSVSMGEDTERMLEFKRDKKAVAKMRREGRD